MILVCGEALIDLFVQTDSPTPTLTAIIGGSPLNLATGLARLGVPAIFFGGISTDYFGKLLVKAMLAEAVDTSLLKRSARPTPLVLVAADDGNPSYTFYAHESAERDVISADMPARLPAAVVAIALGSYALAVEPVGSTLLELTEREADRRVISLDCNLRPAMVGPLDAWRERIERFARFATIIKFSEEDFAMGWEGQAVDDRVSHWLAQGARLIVMTQGAAGATAWHRSGRMSITGRGVRVVDTVGAGDSFHAALLARLDQKALLNRRALANVNAASIEDAMHYATVGAGLTCGRRGADLPRRVEVDEAMGEK